MPITKPGWPALDSSIPAAAAIQAFMPRRLTSAATTAPLTVAVMCCRSSTYPSASSIPSQARGSTCVLVCSTPGISATTAGPATTTVSDAPPATKTPRLDFSGWQFEAAIMKYLITAALLLLARVAAADVCPLTIDATDDMRFEQETLQVE